MDVKLLYELKSELDRVCLGGERSALGNSRIIKMMPLIEKRFDEDVAYQDLHAALKTLIVVQCHNVIETFAAVYTALNYLLRLHGEDIVPGQERTEQKPIIDIHEISGRQCSFLEMKPLINALTGSTEKDRLKIIKKARKEKLFDDFRFYPYLDRALADLEPEIAELVKDIIREDLKDKMLPFLLNRFEYIDRKENITRLELFYELNYEGFDEILKKIIDSGAVNLQAKAIQYISNDSKYEDLLMSLSENAPKSLRERVLYSLANLKKEKAERKLYDLYAAAVKRKNRTEIELIAAPLSQTGILYTYNDVLSQAKTLFNHIITAGKKAELDLFYALRLGISVLQQKGEMPEVHHFFTELLTNKEYNTIIKNKKNLFLKSAMMISDEIIHVLQGSDAGQLTVFYEKVIDEMEESEWKQPFYKEFLKASVCKGDSAEQIYDRFLPYYQDKRINVRDLIEMAGVDGRSKLLKVDPRWLDQLYKSLEYIDGEKNAEALLQVLNILEPDSSNKYNEELLNAGRKTTKYLLEITTMIIKRNLPDKYEVVYDLMKHHNRAVSKQNVLRQLSQATYWSEFPKEYADKIQKLNNAPKAIYVKIMGN